MAKTELILNEDAFKFLPTMDADSIDTLLTDIPYNSVNRKSSGLRNLDKGVADRAEDDKPFDLDVFIKEALRIVRGNFCVFCGFWQISPIIDLFTEAGLQMVRLGVWEKTNPSPMNGEYGFVSGIEPFVFTRKQRAFWNGAITTPVLKYPVEQCNFHPTHKPIDLFAKLIDLMCPPGGIVLDPFAGSLSTAVAAKRTGRGYLCIEQEKRFINDSMRFYGHILNQRDLFYELAA
jgi:site-specific DNA-methyltransferase (adenine-specific)